MASRVYGLDVNPDYLVACEERFPGLAGVFKPVLADMTDTSMDLPKADMVIADLFLEYVGYQAFTTALERIDPRFVSCVIQVNQSMDFVSDSPYARVFDQLDTVYHHIDADSLIHTMKGQGYDSVYSSMMTLPQWKSTEPLRFRTEDQYPPRTALGTQRQEDRPGVRSPVPRPPH